MRLRRGLAFWPIVLVALLAACSGGPANAPVSATTTASSTWEAGVALTVEPSTPQPMPSDTPMPTKRVEVVVTEATESYAIEGSTTGEIFAALSGNSLFDESGVPAIGLTDARWSYEYTARETREDCTMESLTLRLDIVVTLPTLANESTAPPVLRARWRGFAEAVATHEATHVQIERAGVEELRDLLEGLEAESAGCAALENTVERLIAEHRAVVTERHQQFHTDEEARLAEARAPIQARLDAGLASIEARNDSADALKPRIAAVAMQVDARRAELAALVAPYPDGLPEPQYSQAVSLQQEIQQLVSTYNALVEDYNAYVTEVDALVTQRNALLEEYAWVQ